MGGNLAPARDATTFLCITSSLTEHYASSCTVILPALSLYRYRCAQQVEDSFGEVDPFLEAHALAAGKVGDFLAQGRAMDETCASRKTAGGNVVECGIHDVVAEEFTCGVRSGGVELEIGKQCHDVVKRQGRAVGFGATRDDRFAPGLIAIIIAACGSRTAVDCNTFNTHPDRLALAKVKDDIWMQLVDGGYQGGSGTPKRYRQDQAGDLDVDDGGTIEMACCFTTGIALPGAIGLEACYQYFHGLCLPFSDVIDAQTY